MGLNADNIKRLNEIQSFINQNPGKDISLETLSVQFSVSKTTLRRHFRLYFKETIIEYLLRIRMKKAMELIVENTFSIEQIGMAVGYNDRTAFARAFRRFYGKPPHYYWSSNF